MAVSVDVRQGTTTGISAGDRARTVRALADPAATPEQFRRPGHIVPLRYHPVRAALCSFALLMQSIVSQSASLTSAIHKRLNHQSPQSESGNTRYWASVRHACICGIRLQ